MYDPACGSGSLLLAAADTAGRGDDTGVLIFGQDKAAAAVCLARMNMVVHGYFTARIRWGNTLTNPLFRDGEGLRTFDYAVARPPFSDVNWSARFNAEHDPFNRFEGFGVPARERGEYAHLLHVLHSLNPSGQGVCILPRGALSWGGAEAGIRRALVRRGFIKGVIGLPPDLFPGEEIATCIAGPGQEGCRRADQYFLVDASQGFIEEGGRNRLREDDIARILDSFMWHRAARLFAHGADR